MVNDDMEGLQPRIEGRCQLNVNTAGADGEVWYVNEIIWGIGECFCNNIWHNEGGDIVVEPRAS